MKRIRTGAFCERRRIRTNASARSLFAAFSSLGGNHGWLYMNWAWQLRGAIDQVFGGVGMRPRHASLLQPGDVVDFWRVQAIQPDWLLRLRGELRVPGEAWLEFRAKPNADGTSELIQAAIFRPANCVGLCYWYLLYPIHSLIFTGMARKIADLAEELEEWIECHPPGATRAVQPLPLAANGR